MLCILFVANYPNFSPRVIPHSKPQTPKNFPFVCLSFSPGAHTRTPNSNKSRQLVAAQLISNANLELRDRVRRRDDSPISNAIISPPSGQHATPAVPRPSAERQREHVRSPTSPRIQTLSSTATTTTTGEEECKNSPDKSWRRVGRLVAAGGKLNVPPNQRVCVSVCVGVWGGEGQLYSQ